MDVIDMRAADLMIGDYLMYNNMPYRVIQIEGVLRDGWMLENGVEDCGEPIPLTREILEKNGFRKSVSPPGIHAKCYEFENKEEKYHLTIANYNRYKRLLLNVDSEDSECFNIKCDYVHELQHALKMCGIEKEIEL